MALSSCAPLTAQIRSFGTSHVWQSSLGHCFGVWVPWALWDEWAAPSLLQMSIGLLTLQPTGGVLCLPHRALPTHNCHLPVLQGQSWEEGGTQQARSRWSKFLSPSWSKEEKGSPGRLVQQGSVPGQAACRARHLGHPCLALVSPGASEGMQTHLFRWKCPFQEKAGQVMSPEQHVWAPSVLCVSWCKASWMNNSRLVMVFPGHLPGCLHALLGKRNHFLLCFSPEQGEEKGFFTREHVACVTSRKSI